MTHSPILLEAVITQSFSFIEELQSA